MRPASIEGRHRPLSAGASLPNGRTVWHADVQLGQHHANSVARPGSQDADGHVTRELTKMSASTSNIRIIRSAQYFTFAASAADPRAKTPLPARLTLRKFRQSPFQGSTSELTSDRNSPRVIG
jgi:hypothetical protein